MIRVICFILCFPVAAMSQTVPIESGEHATFSRLVLLIGSRTDWEITPTDGGYLINLDGDVNGFRTDTVFDLIPRDRISNVVQRTPDSVFIEVSCECYIDAFDYSGGWIVVDIVDGENPDPDLALVAVQDDENATTVLSQVEERDPNVAFPVLPNLLTLESPANTDLVGLNVPLNLEPQTASPELAALEVALIEGLARAATQGVLDPAMISVAEPMSVVSEQPPTVDSLPMVAGPRTANTQPGVGVSTSVDRDLALIAGEIESAIGSTCLPEDLFSIENWGDDSGFHEQVAGLAEDLAGEFGEEPRDAQDALARLYIHFGFGAEARVVLAADPALSQTRQVLFELAGLIDDYPGSYDLIATQAGCRTPAGLWAFYVNPMRLQEDDRRNLLQQFYRVPQPLRGQIAPRVAQKFIEAGDPETADRVLNASANSDFEATHDVQVTRALIAVERDDPEGAIEVLRREALENSRASPESVVQLINLSLDQDQAPNVDDLDLAAVMQREFRGRPVAEDLAIAEARGRIAIGQYDTALALMTGRDGAQPNLLIDAAYAALTRDSQTPEFLEYAFTNIPQQVTSRTQNAMAERMLDLGFPERAIDLLAAPADQDAAAERRYLRAQGSIAVGDYLAVLDGLTGISGKRADELRSQAYVGLGEYRTALDLADSAPQNDRREALQLRAGAWDGVTSEDGDVLSSFAGAILAPDTAVNAQTLADREAVLSQSQESRRAIENLLQRFDGDILDE